MADKLKLATRVFLDAIDAGRHFVVMPASLWEAEAEAAAKIDEHMPPGLRRIRHYGGGVWRFSYQPGDPRRHPEDAAWDREHPERAETVRHGR